MTEQEKADLIRLTFGSKHPPEHVSGPWYFLRLEEPYGEDEQREFSTRKMRITVILSGSSKAEMMKGGQFIHQFVFDRQPLQPNVTVVDEYTDGDNWHAWVRTRPATPPPLPPPDLPPPPTMSTSISASSPPLPPMASPSAHAGLTRSYIFWDVENCSVSKTDDVMEVLGRINEIMHKVMGYGWTPQIEQKFVYVDPNKPQYKGLNPHLSVLQDLRWTVVNYSDKGTADINMQHHIDVMISEHQNDPDKPAVCLITGDRDFSVCLDRLRRAGWRNTVLVHSPGARMSVKVQAGHAIPWQQVRDGSCEMPIYSHIRDFVGAELDREGLTGILPRDLCQRIHDACASYQPPLPFSVEMVRRAVREHPTAKYSPSGRICIPPEPRRVRIDRPVILDYLQDNWRPDTSIVSATAIGAHSIQICTLDYSHPEWQDQVAYEIESLVQSLEATLIIEQLSHWRAEHLDAFRASKTRLEWQKRYTIAARVVPDGQGRSMHLEVVGESAKLAMREFPSQFIPTSKSVLAQTRYISSPETLHDKMIKDFGVKIHIDAAAAGTSNTTIQCFGFQGKLFAEGILYLHTLVTKQRSMDVPYEITSPHAWLFMARNHDRFAKYFQDEFSVTLSRPADSGTATTAERQTIILQGASQDIGRVIQFLDENVASGDRFLHYRVDLLNCSSYKYKSFEKFIRNMWHKKLSPDRVPTRGTNPVAVGSSPLPLVKMTPYLPKTQRIQDLPFPMDVTVEVWIHENHGEAMMNETISSLTKLDEEFCFREFEIKKAQFDEYIEPYLRVETERCKFYQATGIDGVTWDKHSCTVKIWAASEQIVDSAFEYLMDY